MTTEPRFPGWEHRKVPCNDEDEESKTLETMGNQGWELASLREGGSDVVTLYFKRRHVP